MDWPLVSLPPRNSTDDSHLIARSDTRSAYVSKDRPSVSSPSENSADQSHAVAKCDSRRAYVSASCQWDELHDIFIMLWPGMRLTELMKVMEEDYGFRATQVHFPISSCARETDVPSRRDQYKKKFQEWYQKGALPPKKRKQGLKSQERGPRMIEAAHDLDDTMIEYGYSLPTDISPPDREGSISPTRPIIYQIPSDSDTLLYTNDETVGIYRRRSSHLGTEEQTQFHALHNNLWDTYFDAQFRDAKEVKVGEAVRCMIDFLLEMTRFERSIATVITHPGDMRLLRRVTTLIRNYFSDNQNLCEALEAAVPPLRVRLGRNGAEWRFFYDEEHVGDWDSRLQLMASSAEITSPHFPESTGQRYCCQCGDGPYSLNVAPGCASPMCTGHIFCAFCSATHE